MQCRPAPSDLSDLIRAATGDRACDLLIRGGYVVNVFTGEIIRADIGVSGGFIAAVTSDDESIEARRTIEADNLFIAPGLIDAHMHLESTLLTPAEFARFVLPLGTTTVVIDPHEIANVGGADGIGELMSACRDLPLRFFFTIPPAVPASELETSGGRIDCADIARFACDPCVAGIAEAMDYPDVINAQEETLAKLAALPGMVIDGHAPLLGGRRLQAYAAAGITSDHEATNFWEGAERLRAGMYLMIREGSASQDLDQLIRLVDIHTACRCLLVTDDLAPTDLVDRGHVDHLLRRAVKHGVSAAQAIGMVTINAAGRFKIDRLGAIAPGYAADLVAFEDLSEFRAAFVVADGELVVLDGKIISPVCRREFSEWIAHTVHLPDLTLHDLAIPSFDGEARVIDARDGEIITGQIAARPAVLAGRVLSDTAADILKIAAVERHGKSGGIGLGLVSGFGLKSGAIAGSVAHDAHNVVAVGAGDNDMLVAIKHVGEMEGGLVVAENGEIVAELPLPVGGLMSPASARVTAEALGRLEDAAHRLGCRMRRPFMALSFMCLSVVPELKITDKGLVDVNESRIVPLFAQGAAEARYAAAG